MSRTVPTSLLNALTAKEIEPFYAVELMFDSKVITFNGQQVTLGPLRLWSGSYDKSINIKGTSYTFTGTSVLLNISGIEEVSDLAARNVELTLSGISSEVLSLALQEPYQHRLCNIYFGCEGAADVVNIFNGKIDTMDLIDSADKATFKVRVETSLSRLKEASNWRYTSESHKSRYPGDSFFDYVQDIQDQRLPWGRFT